MGDGQIVIKRSGGLEEWGMWDEGMVDWESREVSVGELGNKGIGDQGIREGGEGNGNSKWFDHELKAVVDNSMEIDARLEELKSGMENLFSEQKSCCFLTLKDWAYHSTLVYTILFSEFESSKIP